MVKMVFSFNVPGEKQAEYLKATKEKIKTFWESHGCQSYDVWQADGEDAFIKEMWFSDMDSMQKSMGLTGVDAEATSAVELFKSFVPNSSRKLYIKQT